MSSSTFDQAYQGIRQIFVRGEFEPGQRVSQSKLARQLGCSTVPVVEAMRRLESEGLLVKQARKMAKVASSQQQTWKACACCERDSKQSQVPGSPNRKRGKPSMRHARICKRFFSRVCQAPSLFDRVL